MKDNVVEFPEQKEVEFIVGPFNENRVVLDGRLIPKLTAYKDGDETWFVLDGRLGGFVSHKYAFQMAHMIANAMAIGAGFANYSADEKFQPFASKCTRITLGDQ